jgi:NAD+ synthase (glutamine-hydrolysing)
MVLSFPRSLSLPAAPAAQARESRIKIMLRIALAQMNSTVGDLPGNRRKILEYIRKAQEREADVVVFPELAVCGYPPEDLLYKDHFVADNIKSLQAIVQDIRLSRRRARNIAVILGFVDSGSAGQACLPPTPPPAGTGKFLYNAAAVIYDGALKGMYYKEELPNYGVFDEKRYFHPGKANRIFALGDYCFGVSICEDIWTEGGICPRQARQGAGLIVNLSSSPYDMDKLQKRRELLKRRALESGVYISYVNLVGGQDDLVFDGGSFIVDPRGKVIASGSQFEEDMIVADLALPGAKRRKPACVITVSKHLPCGEKKPIGRQWAEDLSCLERVYKALVLGTRDYVYKNGFRDVLIGLSGGIDSSLVAVIAVDAIGRENVTGVSMPSPFTSRGTKTDARTLAGSLGIKFLEIPIGHIFQTYLADLKEIFKGAFGVAEENLQARIRGNILMSLSNKWGSLVLTTGNKSEVGVGYCTLYGDMSGGFAVIKDVPKTMVYDLARLVNEKAGKKLIPQSVIDRAPTAELKENQKDQDSLPPYSDLDKMLKEYVEEHRSLSYMARKNDKDLVKKVIDMVDRNEYKRRQAPPGIKITPRAFGKDWRLPITNKYRES